MPDRDSLAVLSRLYVLETWSLSAYLAGAYPWVAGQPAGERNDLLDRIVQDQQAVASRVCEALLAAGAAPPAGEFPLRYTALNDLSLDYLRGFLLSDQRQRIAELERLRPRAQADEATLALLDEALGMERAHLDLLQEPAAAAT